MTPFVVAAGDNVVDCYRGSGTMYPGGNCVNVSVFARRFGARTAYLGQVGDDLAGRHIERALVAEGVETALLRVVEEGRTASCLVDVQDRERVFLESDLGVSMFEPTAAELEQLASADAVHIGSTSGLDAWVPTVAALVRVSYDFAVAGHDEHIATIAPHLFLATFSGGGLEEADAVALARRAIAAGSRWALVTRGAAGAILAERDGWTSTPAVQTDVVDTLGAGDTFLARTLVGLLRGERPDAILAAAATESATTCREYGAFGHPTSSTYFTDEDGPRLVAPDGTQHETKENAHD